MNGYANSLAAFMLDVPNCIERGLICPPLGIASHRTRSIAEARTRLVNTFVHDKWQFRPDITLDLGLRHELYFPLVGYTPVGGQATYDPDTNTIRVAGYGDVPENLGVKTIGRTSIPARGFPGASTTNVFRAGYGVSALGLPSSWGQSYPIRQVQQFSPANSFAPTTTIWRLVCRPRRSCRFRRQRYS